MFRFTSLVVAGCFGAMVASQAPEFMQQYKQRLGGAIDELARVVRHFDSDAQAAGLNREAAVQRFDRSGDPFLINRGASVRRSITRWHDMSDHWRALADTNPFSRLPVFLAGVDRELVTRTWNEYKPAIPTTPEGLVYSGVGFLFSHLLFGGILRLFRGRRPRRQDRLREREREFEREYEPVRRERRSRRYS